MAVTVVTFQSAPVAGARQAPPAAAPDLRELYLSDCGVCHGADGRGTDHGPTLVGVGRASLDYQLSSGRMPLVEAGRADDVPGAPVQPLPNTAPLEPDVDPRRHTPAYPPEVISQLVDYTWNLTGRGGPDIPNVGHGNVAEGGALFRVNCAACHAWAGDGGALVRFQSPALHSATDVQVAEAVRVGPGQMPAFGEAALTDEQLADVVAYVRYLREPNDRGGHPLWHLGPFAEGAVSLAALGGLLVFVRWIGERG
ncbi:MAG: c-type cytochrome [Actinomycetota bacterium]|nr:c-type cytochrome [Actinomycetota bacterium]